MLENKHGNLSHSALASNQSMKSVYHKALRVDVGVNLRRLDFIVLLTASLKKKQLFVMPRRDPGPCVQ